MVNQFRLTGLCAFLVLSMCSACVEPPSQGEQNTDKDAGVDLQDMDAGTVLDMADMDAVDADTPDLMPGRDMPDLMEMSDQPGDLASSDMSDMTDMTDMADMAVIEKAECITPADGIYGASEFVMVWNVSGNDLAVKIPIVGESANFEVDWNNDGMFEDIGNIASATHVYGAPGEKVVRIKGDIPHMQLAPTGWKTLPAGEIESLKRDAEKLLRVEQWGAGREWSDMSGMFALAANLKALPCEAPDLSSVTSTQSMFDGASSFNQDLADWKPLNVEIMASMFRGAVAFNGDVSTWETKSATNMRAMFADATSFNQDLRRDGDAWDLSNIEFIASIFQGATAFNGDIGNWNLVNAKETSQMFNGATSFNQDLSSWKLSRVVVAERMFQNASAFNGSVSGWETENIESMKSMFNGAMSFNQDLSSWNTATVINMRAMFNNASSFNQDLSSWDFISVGTAPLGMPGDPRDAMLSMLSNSGLSTENYDLLLGKLANSTTINGGKLGATGKTYCDKDAHVILTTSVDSVTVDDVAGKGWEITDGGEADNCTSN